MFEGGLEDDALRRQRAQVRRMTWWQWETVAHLSLPWVRRRWAEIFRTAPELHNARHWIDSPEEGHSQLGYETLAGHYNGMTRRGFMTYQQARAIYHGEWA